MFELLEHYLISNFMQLKDYPESKLASIFSQFKHSIKQLNQVAVNKLFKMGKQLTLVRSHDWLELALKLDIWGAATSSS
jgi:hypothetical protein